jgi:hypothetical protein
MATEKKHEDYAEGQNKYAANERILKTDDPGSGPQGIVPDLSARIVIGVFEHADAAQAAMKDLEAAGYAHDDISLVMQQPGRPPEIGAGETKANEGIVAGVSAGAVLGGIAGLAAMAIPGVGAILAAGPIAAALGALSGAALGGLVGSFMGLGVPTEQAKEYEQAVRAGGVVVAVKVDDREDEQRASEVMRGHDPRAVHSYTQAL